MNIQYLYQINNVKLKELLEINYSQLYAKNNEWKYHYVITKILNKRKFTTLPSLWVKLNIEGLRKELGKSSLNGIGFRFIDRIRNDLKTWGLIMMKYTKEITPEGQIRKQCLVKIKEEYTALGWRRWQLNKAVKVKTTENKLTGIYARLQRSLSLLSINYNAANVFASDALAAQMKLPNKLRGYIMQTNRIVDEDVYSSWCMSIDLIKAGIYSLRVEFNDSGRVYSAISSFPRLLRSYLRLNGKPLIELDCANSQPLLFAVYLRQYYKVLTDDMLLWIKLCEDGELYNYLMQLLSNNDCNVPDNKKEFKVKFFANLFYSTESKNHKYRTVFAQYFPNVAAAITKAKKVQPGKGGKPELLTKQLSLLESEIMIKGVAQRLYDNKINDFVTLHDCILTTDNNVNEVYNVIKEEYEKYGVSPKLNIAI